MSGTGNAQGNFTDDNSDDDLIDDKDLVDIDDQDLVDDKDLLDDKDFADDKDVVDFDDQDLVDVDVDAGHPRELTEADAVFAPIDLPEGGDDLPAGAEELADS